MTNIHPTLSFQISGFPRQQSRISECKLARSQHKIFSTLE